MADAEWSAPFQEIDTQTTVPYGDLHVSSPFVATPQKAIDLLLERLKVRDSDFLIDLGCGHGTVNITAAKTYGAGGLGVDIEEELVNIATENASVANVQQLVHFRKEDVLDTDLSPATVVVSFLVPRHLKLIKTKLVEFLSRGGRLACYHYPLQGVAPSQVVKLKEDLDESIFIYSKQ